MSRTRYITQAGLIAALYGGLTWMTLAYAGVFAWGPIQFRVSEALTALALFTPAAIPGLTLGSVLANLLNPQAVWPFSWLDVVLGSLGTFLGAWWTWRFRSRWWLALLGPVVANPLIVASYLPIILRAVNMSKESLLGLSLTGAWLPLYGAIALAIFIGEALVVYVLGLPLAVVLRRTGAADRFRR